ncbi:hypothetical protein DZC52_06470, partial [Wenzhouxiangella sediminis]
HPLAPSAGRSRLGGRDDGQVPVDLIRGLPSVGAFGWEVPALRFAAAGTTLCVGSGFRGVWWGFGKGCR